MDAVIRKTNDGQYYLSVTAMTTWEQLELTAMREQMRESGDVVHEFGGAAKINEEVGRQLDIELNLRVRKTTSENVDRSHNRKRGLIARLTRQI